VGEAGFEALYGKAGCGDLVGEAGCGALLGKAGCGALQENVGDSDCPGTGRLLVVLIARDDRHLPGAAAHGEINETVARDDRHFPRAALIKKKIKFYIRKFRVEQLRSHI
jgi:hypothetical protein